jgi:hypothetical protein
VKLCSISIIIYWSLIFQIYVLSARTHYCSALKIWRALYPKLFFKPENLHNEKSWNILKFNLHDGFYIFKEVYYIKSCIRPLFLRLCWLHYTETNIIISCITSYYMNSILFRIGPLNSTVDTYTRINYVVFFFR